LGIKVNHHREWWTPGARVTISGDRAEGIGALGKSDTVPPKERLTFVPWDALGTLEAGFIAAETFPEPLALNRADLRLIQNAVLKAFTEGSLQRALNTLVSGAIRLTEADYGFAGLCVPNAIRIYAWAGMTWDHVGRDLYEWAEREWETHGYVELPTATDGMLNEAIRTCKTVFVPSRDCVPHGRLPAGHPPLASFIGAPAVDQGRTIALMALGRESGAFTPADVRAANNMAEILGWVARLREWQLRQAAAYRDGIAAQKEESLSIVGAELAHDVNNALFVIRENARSAAGKTGDQAQNDLREIEEAATDASRAIREMISRATVAETVEECDPEEVISESRSMLDTLIGSSEALDFLSSDLGVRVGIGKLSLRRILMNLCANARDASPTGHARVEIGVHLRDDDSSRACAAISVKDAGRGMDTHALAFATEPFFTTKAAAGSGLGLAAVEQLAKQAGGYVTIDSSPDSGTTVTVVFPLLHDDVPASPAVTTTDDAGEGRPLRVLIADDGKVTLKLAAAVCDAAGFETAAFLKPDEALVWASSAAPAPDVLLTDIRMDPFDGYQLAREVRRINPNIKIVYMSGYFPDVGLPSHPDGAQILRKPFDDQELLTVLTEVMK
jgi:signal transduction histidine kinase